MTALTPELIAALGVVAAPMVDGAVQDALAPAIGPADPDAAVARAVVRLEAVHAGDLDPNDLTGRMVARFGAEASMHPAVGQAVVDTLVADQDGHRRARGVFARDLGDAYRAPAAVRHERVQGVLDAEHERVVASRQTRPARAAKRFLDAIRVSDADASGVSS